MQIPSKVGYYVSLEGLQPRSQRECLLPTFQLSVKGLFAFSECKEQHKKFTRHLASCSSNVPPMESGVHLPLPAPITKERIIVVGVGSSLNHLKMLQRNIPFYFLSRCDKCLFCLMFLFF